MIALRAMRPEDLGEVFEVRARTWHNPNGAAELTRFGITPASVTAMLTTSHQGWVAEDAERIVGFAMGNKQTGEMWVIAVLPEFEGRGLGRSLLTHVEQWLAAEGWREIWLTTDPDERYRAVGFYRRLGWRDWKMENGDRFMKKAVTPAAVAAAKDPAAEG